MNRASLLVLPVLVGLAACDGGSSATTDSGVPVDAASASDASTPNDAGGGLDAEAPLLEVQPATLDFGSVGAGSFLVRSFTVKNRSPERVALQPTSSLDEFTLELPTDYDDVSWGQTVQFGVRFAPVVLGDKVGSIGLFPGISVPVRATAVSLPACTLRADPATLHLGDLGDGVDVEVGLVNDGTSPCTVYLVELEPGTSPQLYLLTLQDFTVVAPGTRRSFRLRGTPAPSYTGAVLFYSSMQSPSAGRIPISGGTDAGCLAADPVALDFGGVRCGPRELEVSVTNRCPKARVVSQLGIEGSADFALVGAAKPPFTLAPLASLKVGVRYLPTAAAGSQAKLRVGSDSGSLTVPLTGGGLVSGVRSDAFTQNPHTQVDVLVVADDSGSMADKQSVLGQNLDGLLGRLESCGADFHLGVTTTSVDVAHGGQATTSTDDNGCVRMRGGPVILTPATPEPHQKLATLAAAGASGNYLELVLRPVRLALEAPNTTGCNAGFLRPEAGLMVLLATDSQDANDATPVADYTAFLTGLKPKGATAPRVVVHAAAAGPSSHCSQAGAVPRLDALVSAFSGKVADLCSQGWGADLLADCGGWGLQRRFALTRVPDLAAPMSLTVDGKPLARIGAGGGEQWTYLPAENAIEFPVLFTPPPGKVVEVSYREACP